MDGNCKIVDKLNKERVYGDTLIVKNECANHMVKRGYNAVKGLGHFWTLDHEHGWARLKVRTLLAGDRARDRERTRTWSSSRGKGQPCAEGDIAIRPAT